MMRGTAATAVVLVAFLGIGLLTCGPAGAASPHHTLTGSLEIIDENLEPFGNSTQCDGSDDGGFSDLSAGAQATVKNGSGRILAIGSIKEGKSNYDGATCTMPLRVSGIPKASFYEVEVSHRGELDYSYEQLQNRHWRVRVDHRQLTP